MSKEDEIEFLQSAHSSDEEYERNIREVSPKVEKFITPKMQAQSRMSELRSSAFTMPTLHKQDSSSEQSDSEEANVVGPLKLNETMKKERSGGDIDNKKDGLLDEYNFKKFENLNVSSEIKELFQHILRYVPQKIEMDYVFKPFVPDFIPAIGDPDAFLKVIAPKQTWDATESFDEKMLLPKLGLEVLDEPCANQTDPALLYLQLKATSKFKNIQSKQHAVKKIENPEKSAKAISQWISSVSDLHSSHPPPTVIYKNSMPTIDEVLQDWNEEETMNVMKENLANYKDLDCSLQQYIELMCSLFEIPVYDRNHIESLHVLFKVYLAIKKFYLYQQNVGETNPTATNVINETNEESDNDQVVT